MSYRDASKAPSTTRFALSFQITKHVTEGSISNGPGREATVVPASTVTVVQWASEDADLDSLVVKAHRVLSLYGGDMTPVDPFAKPDER